MPYPYIRKLAGRIYTYLSAVPATVREPDYWFYNISNLAYSLITLLHCFWLVVFYCIGQHTMMLVQLLSIAAYFLATLLNRKGHHVFAMVIALMEVNMHQLVAVMLLGRDTGFQNFIPLVSILPFLKYNSNWFIKASLGSLCLFSYLAIEYVIDGVAPVYILSHRLVSFFMLSNGILCFFLAALWGIVLAISYQRTVGALLKKEQELFASEKAAEQADILRKLEVKERDNEIFQLRNVELKNSNDEILLQKELIEALVSEQEIIISQRTKELAEANTKLVHANRKLVELIQYNAHNLREPLARIMGAMIVVDYMSPEEFYSEIWPQMGKAVNDLDTSIKDVITIADDTIKLYG